MRLVIYVTGLAYLLLLLLFWGFFFIIMIFCVCFLWPINSCDFELSQFLYSKPMDSHKYLNIYVLCIIIIIIITPRKKYSGVREGPLISPAYIHMVIGVIQYTQYNHLIMAYYNRYRYVTEIMLTRKLGIKKKELRNGSGLKERYEREKKHKIMRN